MRILQTAFVVTFAISVLMQFPALAQSDREKESEFFDSYDKNGD